MKPANKMFHVSSQVVSSCGTPFKPGRIPQGKNIKFIKGQNEKCGEQSKITVQQMHESCRLWSGWFWYFRWLWVWGQHRIGQLPAICVLQLRGPRGPLEKDGFVCVYYYCFCLNRITIMITDHWSRTTSPSLSFSCKFSFDNNLIFLSFIW